MCINLLWSAKMEMPTSDDDTLYERIKQKCSGMLKFYPVPQASPTENSNSDHTGNAATVVFARHMNYNLPRCHYYWKHGWGSSVHSHDHRRHRRSHYPLQETFSQWRFKSNSLRAIGRGGLELKQTFGVRVIHTYIERYRHSYSCPCFHVHAFILSTRALA